MNNLKKKKKKKKKKLKNKKKKTNKHWQMSNNNFKTYIQDKYTSEQEEKTQTLIDKWTTITSKSYAR
jgi:RNA polymerase-binding transcription factor DksA